MEYCFFYNYIVIGATIITNIDESKLDLAFYYSSSHTQNNNNYNNNYYNNDNNNNNLELSSDNLELSTNDLESLHSLYIRELYKDRQAPVISFDRSLILDTCFHLLDFNKRSEFLKE